MAYWLKVLGPIISALVALGIAIFHSQLGRILWKPRLKISIDKNDPADCQKTTIKNMVNNQTADCFYFRLRIINEGNATAQNVEVTVEEIFRKNLSNNQFEKWRAFLPLNLKWSHVGQIFYPRIAPNKVYKHCDLGHIDDPQQLVVIESNDDLIRNNYVGQKILILELAVRPYTGTYILPIGTYRLVIVAAADNAKPERQMIELNFVDWYADEARMIRDGIDIRIIT